VDAATAALSSRMRAADRVKHAASGDREQERYRVTLEFQAILEQTKEFVLRNMILDSSVTDEMGEILLGVCSSTRCCSENEERAQILSAITPCALAIGGP
jgi:hypothetical protein